MANKLETKGMDAIINGFSNKTIKTRIIHDGVEYGLFQELTGSGHPSLVPAFEENTKDLPKLIGEAIEKGQDPNDVLGVIAFNIQTDWVSDVNVDTGAFKNSITVSEE